MLLQVLKPLLVMNHERCLIEFQLSYQLEFVWFVDRSALREDQAS